MRVLVCGSSGCVGSAVVRALRWRGHRVIATRRSLADADRNGDTIALDFTRPASVDAWTARWPALAVDAIVNCAGTALPEAASRLADRLHGDGPAALFRGAERAGVARIVNVSALDTAHGDDGWRAKGDADKALLGLRVDAVVVKPSLVYGPRSRSGAALAALARSPLQLLPGGGRQLLQPIHVFELAEAIAALVERTGAARGSYELAGADVVSYRELLAALRVVQGGAAAPRIVLPTSVVRIAARLTGARVHGLADADVLRLIDRVGATHRNAAPVLLGRSPSTLAEGLLVTPPARTASATGAARQRPWSARSLHHSRGVL